jgi:glycolate oxidase
MIDELEKIIDKSRIIYNKDIPQKYFEDSHGKHNLEANALIFPISTEEVSSIMKIAFNKNINVTPIGANTNLAGCTIPLFGGILLDLSKMNKILEIDKETFTATVETGVLLCDLSKAVAEQNLFYAPDPGEKKATIGGNISTNAGGMRAVKYGTTRDSVRGLEVVLSDGRIINVGSKNIKDSSGLSLKHLFIGSEGTLGIITKATVRLFPSQTNAITAVLGFKNIKEAISTINKIMLANTDPVAVEFMERKVVKIGEKYSKVEFPFPDAEAYIIVSYDGEGVDNKIEISEKIAKDNNADFVAFKNLKRANEIWKLRSEGYDAVTSINGKGIATIDIVVPLNRIPDFMDKVKNLEETGLEIYAFGHAGDGNIHADIFAGKLTGDKLKMELEKAMNELYEYSVKKLGGLPSGEHGIGIHKQKYLLDNFSQENIQIMRDIKSIFDPKGILNRGKNYDNR